MKLLSEKAYRLLFWIGISTKGFIGICELILGVMFYYLSYAQLSNIAFFLTGDELSESSRDIFWRYATHALDGFNGTSQTIWAFIFLSHGLIKIALAIGLIKKVRWTYPAAAVIFGLFVVYQCYQYTVAPSFLLAVITLFDVVVIWLIVHEYKTKSKFGILKS